MIFKLFSRPHPATERFSFSHHERILAVILKRRNNTKRLTLRVRDGEIHLTAPPSTDNNDAKTFIIKHFNWVTARLSQDDAVVAHPSSIWFEGMVTEVKLMQSSQFTGRSKVEYTGDTLIIHMAKNSRVKPITVLEEWLKKRARRAIKSSLDDVLPILDEDPVPISIRDQKTRWGSCSTTRRLSFNWRLIMAPPASLHYVVVHEAVHLIHHDHSKRFWDKVEEVMPDYRGHQQWLKTHQQALFARIERQLAGLEGE
jgi:predicted metal-dependent hydrolase